MSNFAERTIWTGDNLEILRGLNSESTVEPRPEPAPSMSLNADELLKLSELRDKGILTAEEFDAQKARLLV